MSDAASVDTTDNEAFVEVLLEESTPLFDEILDELGGYPADVDTEYEVLVAQAVMQLLAAQASP